MLLSNLQGSRDRDADFYLKERPDSLVSFESVTHPGTFVGIDNSIISFTVNLVVSVATGYSRQWASTDAFYEVEQLLFLQRIQKFGKEEVHQP